jgi:chromosome segregation protein
LALVAAIISNTPTPFVLLDEVDAALDEANSQRMARILEDLRTKTQFIIITHNRTVMSIADMIYGVTMSGDGISKLLSVKLEEAKEMGTRL